MFQNKQMLMYGNQLKYFENLKKELESRSMRTANLSYKTKTKAATRQRKLSN